MRIGYAVAVSVVTQMKGAHLVLRCLVLSTQVVPAYALISTRANGVNIAFYSYHRGSSSLPTSKAPRFIGFANKLGVNRQCCQKL